MKNLPKLITNILYALVIMLSAAPIITAAEQTDTPTSTQTGASTANNGDSSTDSTPTPPKPRFCPFAKELTKKNSQWVVGDTWKSDETSFVKEIGNFVGAQWVGIKYGTLICLYRGKENVDFPVALQPVYSFLFLEPSGNQWSGLTKGRKLCQSTNVYDCPFYVKPQENITDIYKQIEYQATPSKSSLDTSQY